MRCDVRQFTDLADLEIEFVRKFAGHINGYLVPADDR
jgi:hypothetical protein